MSAAGGKEPRVLCRQLQMGWRGDGELGRGGVTRALRVGVRTIERGLVLQQRTPREKMSEVRDGASMRMCVSAAETNELCLICAECVKFVMYGFRR